MNTDSSLSRRVASGDVRPEEILAERERLLSTYNLTPQKVFDTIDHAEGKKDVILSKNYSDEIVILRIGERRAEWFFPEGYTDEIMRIPRQIANGGDRIPFEIEEFIPGTMINELERDWSRKGQISEEMFGRLMNVFWRFQTICHELPLEPLFAFEKWREVWGSVPTIPPAALAIVDRYREFYTGRYPAKWKFATDNLLLDETGHVVLIDNYKVGDRFFAYDVGWLIWPRWIEMDAAYHGEIDEHIAYLDRLREVFVASAPADRLYDRDLREAFDLVVFERLLGSLFDVHRQVSHFEEWGMSGDGGAGKRVSHQKFLEQLLVVYTNRLSLFQ